MKNFEVTSSPIDLDVFRNRLVDRSCGGYVQFEGWVRGHNEGQPVLRLEYEICEPLALKETTSGANPDIWLTSITATGASLISSWT